MTRVAWMGLLLGWALLHGAAARADEPAQDAAYEAALERSLTAHASGDYALAEAAMREAHALSPNARTLRGLGVILYAQGRYLEAIEPLEAALPNPIKSLNSELKRGVEGLLGRIWQRVGRLTLRVEPADSEVLIDGAAPLLRGGSEIVLAAGEHHVEISAPAREPYQLSLRVQAGSRDSLHVVLAAAPSSAAARTARAEPSARPDPSASLRPDKTPRASAWTPLLRNSLLIGGGALVAAGAATWLTGYLRFVSLKESCVNADGCEPDTATERYDEERIQPLTTGGLVVLASGAATLLAVGALELWQWRVDKRARGATHAHAGDPHAARTRLLLTGSGVALHAQF